MIWNAGLTLTTSVFIWRLLLGRIPVDCKGRRCCRATSSLLLAQSRCRTAAPRLRLSLMLALRGVAISARVASALRDPRLTPFQDCFWNNLILIGTLMAEDGGCYNL
ncbi:hypothetical protein AAHA92_34025 [Salvia divinorum]|uniref:Secreted protein n=1 Tax=Salvia divinorum TaxID=28513 RepID=A0ABD1FJL0_SALDI